MTLGEQFKKEVVTARPHDSIQHAVRLMRDHGVGAVVIVNDKEEPVGIVTDRDVALAIGTGECDANTSACLIMSSDPVTIDESAGIFNATQYMMDHRVRRLVIVDSEYGTAIGMVTFDDLLALIARELGNLGRAIQPTLSRAA